MRKVTTLIAVIAAGCVSAPAALASGPPVNTSAPVLSGTATVGSTMTVTSGSWTNSPTSYYYDWQHCTGTTCTDISPANNQATYTVKSNDAGLGIRVTVTAYNSSGHNYANSNESAVVPTPPAPMSTSAPVLGGNDAVGSVLTVSPGTWNNSPTSYYYDWQDCTSTTCTSVSPANNQATYTLKSGDVGYYMRVAVTAFNSTGNSYSNSNESDKILTSCSTPVYPAVLQANGQQLSGLNGCVVPIMKGFNMQPAGWPQSSYASMYSEGARIVRTVVFWDCLQPTSGGPIDQNSAYVQSLDAHIAMLATQKIYTTLVFYYGPGSSSGTPAQDLTCPTSGTELHHEPTWAGNSGSMSDYIANGQTATLFLAQRYGNSSSPKYSAGVIGFGINEPTPTEDSSPGWVNTLMGQQATMASWFRASGNAPNWIAVLAFGYAQSAPLPNASGSGQTGQTFAAAVPPTTNYVVDMHDYFMCLIPGSATHFDGRKADGEDYFTTTTGGTAVQIPVDDTVNSGDNSYPPSGVSESNCRSQQAAYIAPYNDYVSPSYANVPLIIGEWGWAPKDGATTFTGSSAWMTDQLTEWSTASPAIQMEWDYNVNQSPDPWAADPGSGATGADPNGWQTATNVFFGHSPKS